MMDGAAGHRQDRGDQCRERAEDHIHTGYIDYVLVDDPPTRV